VSIANIEYRVGVDVCRIMSEQYRALSEAAEHFVTQSQYLKGEGSNIFLEIGLRSVFKSGFRI